MVYYPQDLHIQIHGGVVMSLLMETSDTIAPGLGFSHFDQTHLAWLGFLLVLTVISCLIYRRLGEAGRKRMRLGFAAGLMADELFKYVILLAGGTWTADYLPLHLCSVNIFIIAIHAVKPSKLLGNFLYTVCFPAAMAALLFPSWTKLPFPNLMHIHSFVAHCILALYPVMLLSGGFRPEISYVPRCLLLLVGLCIPGLIVNLLLDCNFMFLMSASPGNPLYLFKKAFGNHLLGYPVLITAVVAVMHLPRWLWNNRKHPPYHHNEVTP